MKYFIFFFLFPACAYGLEENHIINLGNGLGWVPYYLNDANHTPIKSEAQKLALISSTSYVAGDFVPVGPTPDEVALATSTFDCAFDGTKFSGDITIWNLRMLLNSKLYIYRELIENQKELDAASGVGALDVITAKRIQNLKSIREFLRRKYLAL